MMKQHLLFTAMAVAIGINSQAQGRRLVDERDQAQGWYLPVHGEVLVDGKRINDYQIDLYKGDERLGEVAVKKNGKFELDLDIDNTFMIRVHKEGYQDKLVLIDTSLPPDLVTYPDYECFVSLTPVEKEKGIDVFYTDFPSAIVRYNEEMGGFYHSEHYLEHIQNKLSGVAQASF
ncbi:MAG: hypothetical protein H6594_07580 [Flavobacteriales bacterium]|nr:hypothetical protein [Flavobacteriales bacterium]